MSDEPSSPKIPSASKPAPPKRTRKTIAVAIVGVCALGLVLFVAFSGDSNSDLDYSNMCSSPRVQAWAAQAVADKIRLAGLGVVDLTSSFAKLKIVHDARSEAVKKTILNANDVTAEDAQVCAPNGDVSGYTTIVIRNGSSVGGEVLNFGIPGAAAPFGDLPLGH